MYKTPQFGEIIALYTTVSDATGRTIDRGYTLHKVVSVEAGDGSSRARFEVLTDTGQYLKLLPTIHKDIKWYSRRNLKNKA